jgi:DNA-binding GntR family transcriptional regulator
MPGKVIRKATSPSRRGMHVGRIYQQLRREIIRGVLGPGARLVEAEIAERFEVGRTPVREALQMLLQEHYLVSRDGLGRRQLTVASLRADDVEELFGIVADLEVSAVRRVARLDRSSRKLLTERLRAANLAFARISRKRPLDLEMVFDAHREFHLTLTSELAGPRLSQLLTEVRSQLERYEWSYAVLLESQLEQAVEEHQAIIAAVASGDAAEIERTLRRNWESASARLRSVIIGLGDRGIWSEKAGEIR